MKLFNFSSLLASAAVSLTLVSTVGATTVTVGGQTVAGQGMMTTQAGASTVTFNNGLPSSFSFTGTDPAFPLVNGNLSGVYSAPTGDTSNYVTTGTGYVFDTLASGTNYLGFYWGSLDTYNYLSILESNGTTYNVSGADIASHLGLNADGSQSYFVNFYADPGTTFSIVGFTSTPLNAFEFDNLATGSATPEPGTIAMLGGGLLVVAGLFRRRKA